jgi:hypothetical protein
LVPAPGRASFVEPDGVCRAKGFIEYHGFGGGVWNIYMSAVGTCVTERDGVATLSLFASDNLNAPRCPALRATWTTWADLDINGAAAQQIWHFRTTPGAVEHATVSPFRAFERYGNSEVGDGVVRSKFFASCLPDANMPTNVYVRFPAEFEFTTVY